MNSTITKPSQRTLLRLAFKSAAISILLLAVTACSSPPLSRTVSVNNEMRIGRAASAALAKNYGIVRDQNATRYVSQVGTAVASITARQEIQFFFGILDSDEIRTFATPGGYVWISRGALRQLEDEAELAALLGREIAHIAAEHDGPFSLRGGSIAAAAGGTTVTPLDRRALELEEELRTRGRRPAQELAADQAALVYLFSLGYDTHALSRYLERVYPLEEATSLRQTSPALNRRLRDINRFHAANGLPDQGGTTNAERMVSSLRSVR